MQGSLAEAGNRSPYGRESPSNPADKTALVMAAEIGVSRGFILPGTKKEAFAGVEKGPLQEGQRVDGLSVQKQPEMELGPRAGAV